MNNLILFFIFTIIDITFQIYAPAKTVYIHHNYSRVSQNQKSLFYEPNQRQQLYPIYSPTQYYKTKRSSNLQSHKVCPKNSTGQLVYEASCNQFLNCWKGRGFVQNCPPGTLFNPVHLECDFPHKVSCITSTQIDPLKNKRNVQQIECPKNFFGLIPNYNDCTKFFQCNSGNQQLMHCPHGTLFDVTRNICNVKEKVECFNNAQQLNNEIKCPSGTSGLVPHPSDCKKFLNCANGMTFVQECGPGTVFNPVFKVCDFPYNVQCGTAGPLNKDIINPPNNYYDGASQLYPGNTKQNPTIPNYNHIININKITPTQAPFRNSYEPFYGSTTKVPFPNTYEATQNNIYNSNDYDDTNFQKPPPPFIPPSRENEQRQDHNDEKHLCALHQLCNGIVDCEMDEIGCGESIAQFSIKKHKKLSVLERERLENITVAGCALMCLQNAKFRCRSFNYRKMDKCCFLTDTNIALSGTLISYPIIDYYERRTDTVDCSNQFKCDNDKCIEHTMVCDGVDHCRDRSDEKNCDPNKIGYSLRLTDSNEPHQGELQVSAFGQSGYICDDNFNMKEANVACKELGFSLGAIEVKRNSYFVQKMQTGATFYMMDDVHCLGNESKLMECDFSGWGIHNCLNQEAVGVICKTDTKKCADDYWKCDSRNECLPLAFVCDGLLDCSDGSDEAVQHCEAPTQLRLMNGTAPNRGRLEIRHNGIWGTVCDDDFNDDAAKVVCAQLGFKGGAIVKKDAYFGKGFGPIWLDQVFCTGNETYLENCSHWNWGEHNCDHSEDVGIICKLSYEAQERHTDQLYQQPEIKPHRYTNMSHKMEMTKCGYRNDNIFNQNDNVHFRVVQSSKARKGDYPWQAAIRVKTRSSKANHWCGAVIISSRFILTAAHCLIGYAKGAYVVVAGDYNTDEDEHTEQEANLEDFYLHEDFRKGHKMNNDIALIKLKGRGFTLNDDVQAICLPDYNDSYENEMNCTISGFGSIESGSSMFSHDLRAAWIPILKKEICKMPHVYGDALTDGMFCAGSLDGGVDACDGDSGGPLACLDKGLFTLYGITSWGHRCGYANKPGVYVKVGFYKKWIDETLAKHSD